MIFSKKAGPGFNPEEIIFAPTTACNLHCPHCFVNRETVKLSIDDAKKFILSCKENSSNIDKIGFSGGEPFLYKDFLLEIIKFSVEQDLMFDQIMTNGDWWQEENDLIQTLQKIYDAGYDGKFGLSWDDFHGQSKERITTFIRTVQKIFGNDSLNIQYVKNNHNSLNNKITPQLIKELFSEIPLYELPQTFPGNDKRIWDSDCWFTEDFCQGPGQIFYIHPTGNIAPCCGFANENPKLFIGTIKDDYNTVMKNASENQMIDLCYREGLLTFKKKFQKILKSQKKDLPGKCGDICSFCDFVCNNLEK